MATGSVKNDKMEQSSCPDLSSLIKRLHKSKKLLCSPCGVEIKQDLRSLTSTMVPATEKRTPELTCPKVHRWPKLPVQIAASVHSGGQKTTAQPQNRVYWKPRPGPASRLVSIVPFLTLNSVGSFLAHFWFADGQYCRAFPSIAATPGILAARLHE